MARKLLRAYRACKIRAENRVSPDTGPRVMSMRGRAPGGNQEGLYKSLMNPGRGTRIIRCEAGEPPRRTESPRYSGDILKGGPI